LTPDDLLPQGKSAGGAAGTIAGVLGGFSKVVPILGKVVAGLGLFAIGIAKMSGRMAESARGLAMWHGGIARSIVSLDVSRMMRTRAEAKATAAVVRFQLQQQNRLEEAWQPYKITAKSLSSMAVGIFTQHLATALQLPQIAAETTSDILSGRQNLFTLIPSLIPRLFFPGAGALPQTSPLAEALAIYMNGPPFNQGP